jgi:DNA-directed RNA polymerase subunit K/omega
MLFVLKRKAYTYLISLQTKMEELRKKSTADHPEVQAVSRETVNETLKEERVTQSNFSKYEQVVIISQRVLAIAQGAKPLVSIEGMNTSEPEFLWKVAEKELAEGVLAGLIVHRQFPNGKSEFWSASELNINW